MTKQEIEKIVDKYQKVFRIGLMRYEIESLLDNLEVDKAAFYEEMAGNTGTTVQYNGKTRFLSYPHDVVNALHKIFNGTHLFFD